MKFRIRHAEQIVGAFILVALLFVVAILVFLGINQRWFAQDYRFTSKFLSANGVTPGTGIYFKGFMIGKTDYYRLEPDNTVTVGFHIMDTYIDKVKENSVLEYSASPIAALGSSLLFHSGISDKLAPENSYIPSLDTQEGKDLVDQGKVDIPPKDDSITRLLSNINPLLENINKTVLNLNKTILTVNNALSGKDLTSPVGKIIVGAQKAVDELQPILDNVNKTVNTANATIEDIGRQVKIISDSATKLIGSLDKDISATIDNVNKAIASLNESLANIQKFSSTLTKEGDAIFGNINSILVDVNKAIKNIEAFAATLNDQSPQIVTILAEINETLKQAQEVLEGLKNNPLIKGGIPTEQAQAGLYQSLREGEF